VANTSNPAFDMELIQLIWTQDISFVSPNPVVISNTPPNFEQLQPGDTTQHTVQIVPAIFPFQESTFDFEFLFKDDIGVACCTKFEELRVPVPNCFLSLIDTVDIGINVFPNPFSEQFTIQFNKTVEQSIQLKLYDIYGRELMKRNIDVGTNELTIESKGLSAGVYFLELTNVEGLRVVEKLINH